jgi:hypothetical protein
MKKVESEMEDDLRSEYDLNNLRIRRVGSGRKSFADMSTNEVLNTIKEDVTQGLQYWRGNEELSNEVRQKIANANVLFIPLEGDRYREDSIDSGKVFAPGAEGFFKYLLDSDKKDIKADMCVNDGEYRRLALYAEPITLTVIGTIVISSIVAPVIKDLLLDYIRENKSKSSKNLEFRVTLIIDNENGFIREIQCSGSSVEVEKFLSRMIDQALNQVEHDNGSITKKLESKSNITLDRNTARE